MMSEKGLIEFVDLISRLNAIEFLGILKLLEVPLLDDKNENKEREFHELVSDMIDRFITLNRKQRREIVSILRRNLKEKMKNNGTDTKHSTE